MAIYMQIEGIDGPVTAKGYEKWIELNTFEFGVSRSINTQPGRVTDRESTRPSVADIIVHKNMDKSSPLLFTEACVGKTKKIQIHLCQTGDTISPYAEYTIENALVSSYGVEHDPLASGSHNYPSEQLQFNFDKIEMKYIPYDEQHKAQSPIPAGYDLKTAQKV